MMLRGLPGPAGAAPAFEHLVPIGRAYVAAAGVLTIPVLFLLARRAAGPVAAIARRCCWLSRHSTSATRTSR